MDQANMAASTGGSTGGSTGANPLSNQVPDDYGVSLTDYLSESRTDDSENPAPPPTTEPQRSGRNKTRSTGTKGAKATKIDPRQQAKDFEQKYNNQFAKEFSKRYSDGPTPAAPAGGHAARAEHAFAQACPSPAGNGSRSNYDDTEDLLGYGDDDDRDADRDSARGAARRYLPRLRYAILLGVASLTAMHPEVQEFASELAHTGLDEVNSTPIGQHITTSFTHFWHSFETAIGLNGSQVTELGENSVTADGHDRMKVTIRNIDALTPAQLGELTQMIQELAANGPVDTQVDDGPVSTITQD